MVNVGTYASPMDGMGLFLQVVKCIPSREQSHIIQPKGKFGKSSTQK